MSNDARRHWSIRLWLRIQEPRIVTLAQMVIYIAVMLAGISTIGNAPQSIEGQFGPMLTYVWALMAVGGGALGLVSTPRGVWWLEKPAIWLCAGSTAVYAGMLFSLHVIESGNRMPQFWFIIAILFHFVARYARIRRYAYDPEK